MISEIPDDVVDKSSWGGVGLVMSAVSVYVSDLFAKRGILPHTKYYATICAMCVFAGLLAGIALASDNPTIFTVAVVAFCILATMLSIPMMANGANQRTRNSIQVGILIIWTVAIALIILTNKKS